MNKLSLIALFGMIALSSCGRGNYNGKYSGTETASVTNNIYQNVGYNSSQNPITIELTQSGDMVTGTYYKAGQARGQFTARATTTDRLDQVQLFIGSNNNFYTNDALCPGMYTGSLMASVNSESLNGTLSPQNNTNNMNNGMACGSVMISVQRGAPDNASPSAAQFQQTQPTQ
jgi:hypothetical protein